MATARAGRQRRGPDLSQDRRSPVKRWRERSVAALTAAIDPGGEPPPADPLCSSSNRGRTAMRIIAQLMAQAHARARPVGRACALAAAVALPAHAQTGTIDKPITIYVAGTAGGGIDLYGRIVGKHLGRHIAGNPPVNVQVMPGAGGIRAANFLAEQAPRDGTAIGTFAGGPVLEPLIGARNPGYDMSQFTWIGAITKDVQICIAWGTSPFRTIDDVIRQQMIVAGTGAGSETDTWPVILNEVLGTKFKLVTGYLGTQETFVAMERGEAHGRCGMSLSALKSAKPDWVRDRKVNILVQIAAEAHPEMTDVPLIFDRLVRTEDRQAIQMLSGPTAMARPFVAPPGVPAQRATLLRRAFDATMTDPEFLADAAKIQAEVMPTTGEVVQKRVAAIYATPRPVIERVKGFFTH
jgi:tripartite-type tricarboxylate transporter receptor subunit TctC